MKEVYEGFAASLGPFVQAWLVPSTAALALFGFVLFPTLDHGGPWADIATWNSTSRILLIGFSAVVLAFLLSASATLLYRILEGYVMPEQLRQKWTSKRLTDWEHIRSTMPTERGRELEQSLERFGRYPRSRTRVMPTRFGNVLRAGESHGRELYGLDTVQLWRPLAAAAPETTTNHLATTRTLADFFVGAFWLSLLWATFALLTAPMADAQWPHLVGAVVALSLSPLFYRGSVTAAVSYSKALRELVDVGRKPLAHSLGLRLPASLAEERELWRAVASYESWGTEFVASNDWIKVIDQHRAIDEKQPAGDATPMQSRADGPGSVSSGA